MLKQTSTHPFFQFFFAFLFIPHFSGLLVILNFDSNPGLFFIKSKESLSSNFICTYKNYEQLGVTTLLDTIYTSGITPSMGQWPTVHIVPSWFFALRCHRSCLVLVTSAQLGGPPSLFFLIIMRKTMTKKMHCQLKFPEWLIIAGLLWCWEHSIAQQLNKKNFLGTQLQGERDTCFL